jgi:hypothetical protein
MAIENVLKNAIDMHIHCAPDTGPRYGDSVEIATIAREAGMRAIVVKDHLTQTVHKASITNELVPGFTVFGAAALNLPTGGLSPRAAAFFTALGAKVIWLPTMDSEFTWLKADQGHYDAIYATRYAYGMDYQKLTLLTGGMYEGVLREEVKQIVDVVAKADVVLCSGHHTPQETIALFEYIKAIGFERAIVTHVNAFPEEFNPEVLDRLVSLGAILEISNGVLVPRHARQDPRDVVKIIRQVGAEQVVLVSDAGQLENPSPAEALRSFCHILIKEGITPEEVDKMIVATPTRLLNLEPVKEEEK